VVVVAAGNLGRNGYGTITAPGNSPNAITVGVMKTMGNHHAHRRPDRQLQLTRSHAGGYGGKAGPGGAGESGSFAAVAGQHARE